MEDMDVVAVHTGEAAMEEVQSRRFDLFMIDIMLPGKHGAEVAWYLKRHAVTAPIVAISAVIASWEQEDLFDCGFNRLMPKPFDLDEVRQMARDVVSTVENRPG